MSAKDRFVPMKLSKLQVRAPMIPQHVYAAMKAMPQFSGALPKYFNWAESKTVKINPPQDQGQCGSCWAVSTSSALGDKWAIAAKQPKSVMLAPLNIAQCVAPDNGQDGCDNGGYPSDAANYAAQHGLLPLSCWSYACECPPPNIVPPKCTQNIPGCPRIYVKPGSVRSAVVLKPGANNPARSIADIDVPATIDLIKTSIYTTGPVVAAFVVPENLSGDIPSDPNYIFKADRLGAGGHAVKLVGWGEDSQGQLYWIMENSWGTSWANKGYVKMYAYPLNNIGLDLPLFESPHLQAARGFRDDHGIGGFGGVILSEVDLQRSPKTMPESLASTALVAGKTVTASEDSTWTTHRKVLLGVGLGMIAVGIFIMVMARNSAKKSARYLAHSL